MAHTHTYTGTDLGASNWYPVRCLVRYFLEHSVWAQPFIYSTKIYPAPTVCQALFKMPENHE